MTTPPSSQLRHTPEPEDSNDSMLEFESESSGRKSQSKRNGESTRPGSESTATKSESTVAKFKSTVRKGITPQRNPTGWKTLAIVVLVLLVGGGWALSGGITRPSPTGTLRVESEPAGADVEVDGAPHGRTPLTITLPAGSHAVVVSLDAEKQDISAIVSSGIQAVHHVRFSGATVPSTGHGRLQVAGDVLGATIVLDGVRRGTAPATLDGIAPGEHQVVIQSAERTHRRAVIISAGATASLVITNAPPGNESGWMSAKSSTPLLVYEGGKLIGTTELDRIMLPAGRHDLEFVASALGFRARRDVTIAPGQTSVTPIVLPQVPANINADPWADVTIDGVPSGQTPIANHQLTIGTHEVEFRHPSLGTKRSRITVSLSEPARLSVDMRAP